MLTELMRAIEKRNLSTVHTHLSLVGLHDNDGLTALMYASREAFLEAIPILLEHEAGLRDTSGNTALILAAIIGEPRPLPLLLPVEMSLVDNNGWTALMWAAWRGHSDCAYLLLPEAGNTAKKEWDGHLPGTTALMLAVKAECIPIIVLLLPFERGLRDVAGRSALWYAQNGGNSHIISLLEAEDLDCIERSLPPNELFPSLITAAITCDTQMAKDHLDEAGRRYVSGQTALMYAVRYGHLGIVTLLRDFELGLRDDDGRTALELAIEHGRYEIALELACEYEDSNISMTMLHIAARAGDLDALRRFSTYSGRRDDEGWTALMRASEAKHKECVELLLAEARMQTTLDQYLFPIGTTALHIAAAVGALHCVEALMVKEDDLRNKLGQTALIQAATHGHCEIVKLLLHQAGHQDAYGRTALMQAAVHNMADVIPLLLDQEKGFLDNSGHTALYFAMINNNEACAKLLLDEALVPDPNGETVFEALASLRPNIIRVLFEQLHAEGKEHLFFTAPEISDTSAWTVFKKVYDLPANTSDLIASVAAGCPYRARHCLYQIEMRDLKGRTALMYAAAAGNESLVSILSPWKGAVDNRGWSALMYALEAGQESCAELLLEEAGIGSSVYGYGFPLRTTALMIAMSRGLQCPSLIKNLRAKEEGLSDIYGWTALMNALHCNNIEGAWLLLNEAGRVSTCRAHGFPSGTSALMLAALIDSSELLYQLRKKELGIQDALGDTALIWALRCNNMANARLLIDEVIVHDEQGRSQLERIMDLADRKPEAFDGIYSSVCHPGLQACYMELRPLLQNTLRRHIVCRLKELSRERLLSRFRALPSGDLMLLDVISAVVLGEPGSIQGLDDFLENLEEKWQEHEACIICFAKQVNTVLLPCRHLIACDICAGRLTSICPYCRCSVTSTTVLSPL
ncbi:Ankyrin repeat protein 2 [Giardia muris]|uniref:Ankyrin repeat protein 2 n=1 Tax=Giardia muris TaxID=5742 RepID=A0A4Z1TAD6_GIAMU|nr:Ankyrin repeat protein 2 [Giardia muris]|eukprot:TNJ29481.1 Ankyrin repeat protein 2 [Giardia muris]